MHFNKTLFFFATIAAVEAFTLKTSLVSSVNSATFLDPQVTTVKTSTLAKSFTTGFDSTNNIDLVQDKIVINPKNVLSGSQAGVVVVSSILGIPQFHPRFGTPVETFHPRIGIPINRGKSATAVAGNL